MAPVSDNKRKSPSYFFFSGLGPLLDVRFTQIHQRGRRKETTERMRLQRHCIDKRQAFFFFVRIILTGDVLKEAGKSHRTSCLFRVRVVLCITIDGVVQQVPSSLSKKLAGCRPPIKSSTRSALSTLEYRSSQPFSWGQSVWHVWRPNIGHRF